MLTLPIKKKWFDMILSGEKKEEYRDIKPYYVSRFSNQLPNYKNSIINAKSMEGRFIMETFQIIFRNGYSKKSPSIKCLVTLAVNYGKKEWGAEPNKLYYVLKILEVEEITNIKEC